MVWVELITLLAALQAIFFGILVGRARGRYGVQAPATTGNELFERYYRVQCNTNETLLIFLPSLWIAAHYWIPGWAAILGAIYLVGRMFYLRGYVRDPKQRGPGYGLSMLPTMALLLIGLVGVVRALLRA
ncbi:MAG TPA: MAPEG family protein [Steroidobacteraceae bacterium]|nr:MAPEG family protein [Steroidobacteraceae bacterium]